MRLLTGSVIPGLIAGGRGFQCARNVLAPHGVQHIGSHGREITVVGTDDL
jgi:hypothetical protein